MNRDDAIRTIDALCKYVTSRVAKARKFKQNGNASAEILTAVDRADYMLEQADELKQMLAFQAETTACTCAACRHIQADPPPACLEATAKAICLEATGGNGNWRHWMKEAIASMRAKGCPRAGGVHERMEWLASGDYRVTFDEETTHPLKIGVVVYNPGKPPRVTFECDAPHGSKRGIDSASAQAHIQEALWPYLRDGVGYEASDAVIDVLKELEKPTC